MMIHVILSHLRPSSAIPPCPSPTGEGRLSRLLGSIISAVVLTGVASAQMPQELVNRERAKILQGVTQVPRTGAPGPVAVWGSMAFPLLAAPDTKGVEQAVAAAAGYGKGRVILFGHNGYLTGGEGSDHAQLMRNCVHWAGAKQKPNIGLKGVNAAGFYESVGKTKVIDGPLTVASLKGFDVVVLNIQGITDTAEGEALLEWVKQGGGVIAGMTGWAYGMTSGGKELSTTHGVNRALLAAGVGITELSGFDRLPNFQARADLPAMLNASAAVAALHQQTSGGAAMTPEDARQGASAIQIALAAQPPDRNQLRSAVVSALGGERKSGVIPTKQSPLTEAQHAAERIHLGMESRWLRLAPSEQVRAHPSHTSFPGQAPSAAEAPRVARDITVKPSVPGWTSTGLYAAAGERITVTVPAAAAGQGYAVRIGCHSDGLYHLDSWSRAPDINKTTGLQETETALVSAFGGLIYIEVPDRSATARQAVFTARVQGAIPAPLFVLGQDTDEQWNTEIKKRPAPWAELACDHMIVTVPTEVARTVNNPTQLMKFWQEVVITQDELCNQAAERKRPERMVADVQISAGFMHSGYPIMIHVPEAQEMVTYGRLRFPGWGFYHEIGHNHQRPDFTFDGSGEVTNNVIGMYCYEAVLKKDWLIGHSAITPENRQRNITRIKAATTPEAKWALWKADPFLALVTYIQLVQEFGWESWRTYLHSFADPAYGPKPKNDDERRDQFLVRYSKITKKNLGPFFELWGIPVSSAAKAEVSKLETWMPKDS